jgi:hypothetical protein
LDGVPVGDRDDDLGQWTLRERNATVRYLGLRRYAVVERYETTDGETVAVEEYANLRLAGYRAPSFMQAGRWDRILLCDLDRHSHLPSLTYVPGPDSLVPVYAPYRVRQTVYPGDVPVKAHGEWSVHADAEVYDKDPKADVEIRIGIAGLPMMPNDKDAIRKRRLALAPC